MPVPANERLHPRPQFSALVSSTPQFAHVRRQLVLQSATLHVPQTAVADSVAAGRQALDAAAATTERLQRYAVLDSRRRSHRIRHRQLFRFLDNACRFQCASENIPTALLHFLTVSLLLSFDRQIYRCGWLHQHGFLAHLRCADDHRAVSTAVSIRTPLLAWRGDTIQTLSLATVLLPVAPPAARRLFHTPSSTREHLLPHGIPRVVCALLASIARAQGPPLG